MTGYPCVSLTTDYGLSDGFVAACHGVIARLAPAVRIIDVTHAVPPADIYRGAAVLAQTAPHLPPAVHVAVVDPGVGTARRGIALRAADGVLVGPDNGLLLWAADALGGVREAVELTAPDWFPPASTSATFHGRDVFAPAAARFATGAPLRGAGPLVDPEGLVRLAEPVVAAGPGRLESTVLTVDHFGNVQLAATADDLTGLAGRVRVGSRRRTDEPDGQLARRGRTFGDVPPGELVVFVDSSSRVAVGVNGGRAADALVVAPGDVLYIVDDR